MSLSVLLPVMLIILTGACVQSALGFGATMVTMGFLPLLMDYGKALGLSIALVTISTAYISVKYRKQIQWKIMLPFLIPTAVICGIVNFLSAKVSSVVSSKTASSACFRGAVGRWVSFQSRCSISAFTASKGWGVPRCSSSSVRR